MGQGLVDRQQARRRQAVAAREARRSSRPLVVAPCERDVQPVRPRVSRRRHERRRPGRRGDVAGSPARTSAPTSRPTLNELQWIQYQLDNFGSVAEMTAAAPGLRVSPVYALVHYLACDKSGACAAFEHIGGKQVVTAGARALTNHPYAESAAWAARQAQPPAGVGSLARFARAARHGGDASRRRSGRRGVRRARRRPLVREPVEHRLRSGAPAGQLPHASTARSRRWIWGRSTRRARRPPCWSTSTPTPAATSPAACALTTRRSIVAHRTQRAPHPQPASPRRRRPDGRLSVRAHLPEALTPRRRADLTSTGCSAGRRGRRRPAACRRGRPTRASAARLALVSPPGTPSRSPAATPSLARWPGSTTRKRSRLSASVCISASDSSGYSCCRVSSFLHQVAGDRHRHLDDQRGPARRVDPRRERAHRLFQRRVDRGGRAPLLAPARLSDSLAGPDLDRLDGADDVGGAHVADLDARDVVHHQPLRRRKLAIGLAPATTAGPARR